MVALNAVTEVLHRIRVKLYPNYLHKTEAVPVRDGPSLKVCIYGSW
jgi:hypothetical protein